ncbi:MAG TPA: DNA recombination protein RmuC [Candidatus Omnitrophica bacterium]|nr:DNA recombination protein RmuC [Candidatus Omnitrophota bacterium]
MPYLFLGIFFSSLILIVILVFKLIKIRRNSLFEEKLSSFKEEIRKNFFDVQNVFLNSSQAILKEFSKIYEKLGSLDKETQSLLNLTTSFYDLFKPTKTRAILGEAVLKNLAEEVLPKEVVFPQYTFKNGKKVDLVIKLPEGLVPIDAKFSLEGFRKYLDAPQQEKERYKKLFIESVKKRIDETSSYILTDEKTTDFSLMYIPSEAVYYFLITETDILDYAYKKKVFLVGPNNFYVYLNTILVGLKALKIEKKSKEVYNLLERLNKDLESIQEDHFTLGIHLKNASLKFEEIRKKLENFNLQLKNVSKEE